ncbi:MAG TPA: hypothetical protein VGW75_07775 [Solirubrobacteraceae bacterium]|nr:hypothetical protein [Solirubrobacteraceae bacterium]
MAAASASDSDRELARVLRWTLGVPTAALLSLAALYVLGALWKWGEIQDAGLVPTDVLSLVPHAQILGRGAQLVVLAVLALPLPLAFAWLLHRVLPDRARPWGVPAPLGRLVADHRRLRRDLDELRGEADPIAEPGRDRRVRRLHARARAQEAVQRRTVWLSRAAVAAAVAAGLAVLSPARLCAALFGLWLVRRTSLSTLRIAAAVFAALVLAVAAERFTAPDPLPDASVRTTRGVLVKGPLVAAGADAWHVEVADRRVKSIPTVNIAKSSVYSQSRLVRGPLGARLIDLLR